MGRKPVRQSDGRLVYLTSSDRLWQVQALRRHDDDASATEGENSDADAAPIQPGMAD
jgi:hypothetical protein